MNKFGNVVKIEMQYMIPRGCMLCQFLARGESGRCTIANKHIKQGDIIYGSGSPEWCPLMQAEKV